MSSSASLALDKDKESGFLAIQATQSYPSPSSLLTSPFQALSKTVLPSAAPQYPKATSGAVVLPSLLPYPEAAPTLPPPVLLCSPLHHATAPRHPPPFSPAPQHLPSHAARPPLSYTQTSMPGLALASSLKKPLEIGAGLASRITVPLYPSARIAREASVPITPNVPLRKQRHHSDSR